jgi:hypothetical protein
LFSIYFCSHVRVRVCLHHPVCVLNFLERKDRMDIGADLSTASTAGDARQDFLTKPGKGMRCEGSGETHGGQHLPRD